VSGICGFVGDADPKLLDAMLAAIEYRGDLTDVAHAPGASFGYRFWAGRPGKSTGIHRSSADLAVCAGTFAPPVPSPAEALPPLLAGGVSGLSTLDGAFAGAWWDGDRRRLTLVRDPFGVRSLYYVEHAGVFYFASELKQLLAVPDLPVEVDPVALHKYLTFSLSRAKTFLSAG
jgi:asparagine synthase (glutamine-hydrolysing)